MKYWFLIGLGLTKSILAVLSTVLKLNKEKLQSRLTGLAADGQYFNLNVDDHLNSLLDQQVWLTATWDPAHKIELGVEDARKEEEWVKSATSTIMEVLKQVARGKAYEEVLKFATDAGEDLASVGLFSGKLDL